MSQLLEATMLILFGISWPFSITKSWKSRTSKGKSIIFLSFVLCGYLCGIIAKLVSGHITYVLTFYIMDFLLVATDTCFFIRNDRLDKLKEQEASTAETAM